MKQILYSAMALSIAIGGAAMANGNSHFAKKFFVLKPGKTHTSALTPADYTIGSVSQCPGAITICGITATATSAGLKPNLTANPTLHSDLVSIQASGGTSNASGAVRFHN